jgi:hypothetical protein
MAEEVIKALKNLEQARRQFNMADKEHIDAACYALKAAEERYSTALRLYKLRRGREQDEGMERFRQDQGHAESRMAASAAERNRRV